MFFLLSKILTFFCAPLTWIVLGFVVAILSNNIKKKKKFLIASFIALLVFSNTFLFDRFMNAWEVHAIPDDKLGNYDIGILLTGMSTFDPQINRLEFNDRTDRLLQTIKLFKENKIQSIILSGGPINFDGSDTLEGPILKKYIESLGIPSERIILELHSRNTHENAVNLKYLATDFKGKKILLISSAAHLPRATLCFKKEGIPVFPYSTDRYSGPVKFEIDYLILPSASTLFNWEKLIHEWVGIISYKIAGYI
jgi:uncharacterized SAM-binding protein YcdF (DUF218 family)